MRLHAILLAALLAPALLAAQPATPLIITDERTAALGGLLGSDLVAPHRLVMLPGDTLLWERPDTRFSYRIPLRAVDVVPVEMAARVALRCRAGDCIREESSGRTRQTWEASWFFYRRRMDNEPGESLVVIDTALMARGEIALRELVAAVAGPATQPPADSTAAERLVAALWNSTRVLPVRGDTLVVVEDERWTYHIPLSRAEVVTWPEHSQVGFRCRARANCIRVSMPGTTYRMPELPLNVHESKRAAALQALRDIAQESGFPPASP
ncbi:MAG TPA: hypothetical protein VLK84_16390 [Longimicrobium sp.]|nr:hypothetical protein [Longimicrobium sp.]